MSNYNPMRYFVSDDSASEANAKTAPKNKNQISLQSAFNRFDSMAQHIHAITGLPDVKRLLEEWNMRQKTFWIRKEAGLKETQVLPEILVISGGGPQELALEHIAKFCHKTGFLSVPTVNYYNVTKLVNHYTVDTRDEIKSIFGKNRSALINFYGFDELIANPRPPMADWYDWVDIIVNFILDNVDACRYRCPVTFSISKQNYRILQDRFTRFEKFSVETVHCAYSRHDDLAKRCVESLKDKNYIVSAKAVERLNDFMSRYMSEPDARRLSEPLIVKRVIGKILDNQATRLNDSSAESLTSRKIKTIQHTDIPSQSVFVSNDVIFY